MHDYGKVFSEQETIACKLCGATQALPGDFDLCLNCFSQFQRSAGGRLITADGYARLLAEAIRRQIARVNKHGFSHRCESIATTGLGWQCGLWASTQNEDGRFLCRQHGKRKNPVFVSPRRQSEYDRYSDILADLARDDDQFFECLDRAVTIARRGAYMKHAI